MKPLVKKVLLAGAVAVMAASLFTITSEAKEMNGNPKVKGEITMTQESWDKVFPKMDNVTVEKVHFKNRFGIELVADVYKPKDVKKGEKLPGIALSGPFGAVKEQVSGLYARHLASKGYVAVAFDPSFTGESGGEARDVASPDINTEDFQAAVDYLISRPDVDGDKIGIVGICGFGGFALNAASVDTRIKATVTSTAYDMTRVMSNGYFDEGDSLASRRGRKQAMNAQREKDFLSGKPATDGGVVDPLPADAPWFVKDYYDYYKTKRGYHPRSVNSNKGFITTNALPFINGKLLVHGDEIESAVLMIHGSKAHSLYFSKDMFKKLKGDNKELFIIDGATHVDLYDNVEKIPFDRMDEFFKKYL